MLHNIKLEIAYCGTNYIGWQRQPIAHGVSVQACLEKALRKVVDHPVQLVAAGRTDAGVHSFGQVANFTTDCSIPPANLPKAMRGYLPEDIFVRNASYVPADFNARRSAIGKLYYYTIAPDSSRTAFNWQFAHFLVKEPNIETMNQAAKLFLGEHDFYAFAAKGTSIKNYCRRIDKCEWVPVKQAKQGEFLLPWQQMEGPVWMLQVAGNGFIYKMVRLMAGAMLAVGYKRLGLNDIERALTGQSQIIAPPAPPQGLTLMEVFYDAKSTQLK